MNLPDVRVAMLISDGFDEPQVHELESLLSQTGATLDILAFSPEEMRRGIQGMHGMRPSRLVQAKCLIQDASPESYQGLLIPGGALSVDRMRASRFHVGFVQNFLAAQKPIGSLGHGPWLLADSGSILGMTVTSSPTIRKDIERSGAIWKDQQVVCDGSLVTHRGDDELSAFLQAIFEKFSGIYHFNAA